MSKLTVRSIRLASGERIALLTHGPLGLPVYRSSTMSLTGIVKLDAP